MIEKRICIIGLGLMGGSLARALKGQVGQIVGVDRHAATRQLALADGVVDIVTGDLASGIKTADLVILATPVNTILHILAELPKLRPRGCLVMDLGSTKEEICAAMSALPDSFAAIGGHPMCGKETAGYHAADAQLFRGQTFILSPNDRTNHQIEEISLSLVDLIGAKPMFLPANEHDQLVAVASHLPYLISAALIHLAADMGDERVWPVSASGFRDTTRLAGSDPRMMLEILLTNRTAVLSQLTQYKTDLEKMIRLLDDNNETALALWLQAAQQEYVAYRRQKMDSSTSTF
jgi:prephenate dehydrogenase